MLKQIVGLVLLSVIFFIGPSSQQECVRLSDCSSLSWLNTNGVQYGFTRREIHRQINRAMCDGNPDIVRCPLTNDVEGEKDVNVQNVLRCQRSERFKMSTFRMVL